MASVISPTDICLVRGPFVLAPGVPTGTHHPPPIGMASLAAFLRRNGFAVFVIDGYGEAFEKVIDHGIYQTEGLSAAEIAERIPDSCGIVGISCMFSNTWHYHRVIIREIRRRRPDITIVMGGEHATALSEYCLRTTPELDYILTGEGELAFTEFLRWILSGRSSPIEALPNLHWRDGLEIKANPRGPRIRDIDSLPYPAWDLYPIERYLARGASLLFKQKVRTLPMITSRGCPYACKFCTCKNMWESRYYRRSVGSIVGEIRFLVERYQVEHIDFFDMTFAMSRRHLAELCQRIENEKLGLTFNITNTRAEILDDEIVAALRRAGCRYIPLSVESASKTTLENMNKRLDLKMMQRRIRTVVESGIQTTANLILGLPDEGHRDTWKTLLLGWKMAWLGVSGVTYLQFMPYPGSEYHERMKKEGWFPADPEEFNRLLVRLVISPRLGFPSCSRHISTLSLYLYRLMGIGMSYFLYFVRRPRKFARHLRNVWNHESESNYDQIVSGLLRLVLPGRKKSEMPR